MLPLLIAGFVLLIAGALYWELWICEGTHLGRRFVVWSYDLAARRYERIKSFDWEWEERFLGEPVARTIGSLEAPYLLDVGAGTGRLARSLHSSLTRQADPNGPAGPILPEPDCQAEPPHPEASAAAGTKHLAPVPPALPGLLVCLEPSRQMLRLGKQAAPGWACWLRAWAAPLPFPEAVFDLISCLEVLEFTPDPLQTLEEVRRTLRPGGWLLLANRRGMDAKLILGKTMPKHELTERLRSIGFHSIQVYPWQVDYDLVWACKNG